MSQNLLKIYTDQHKPDLMKASESNFKGDEANRNKGFPEYKFYAELRCNMKISKLIVLIWKVQNINV